MSAESPEVAKIGALPSPSGVGNAIEPGMMKAIVHVIGVDQSISPKRDGQ